jgi:hypothetical protein
MAGGPSRPSAATAGDRGSALEARQAAPATEPSRARAAPEARKGLATHWGEARYSPVREVEFERADAARPTDVLEMHYDDRAGARQMLPGGDIGQSELSALSGAVGISMLDASGQPFPALRRGDHMVSMGGAGQRYSLAITNRSAERFEVVVSVDGLDVLDGDTANLSKRGYLVEAHARVVIDGFRQSAAEVASFRLGDVAGSYAASKGQARNVGVIGFALFAERNSRGQFAPTGMAASDGETYRRRTAEPFPGRYAQPPRW